MRYTVAAKKADTSADTATPVTLDAMRKFPPEKVKTITFDNGKEFAGFKELERGLDIRSYFAGSYHSWERGTNKNTNGLLRQFFPRGMDFGRITQSDVDIVLELLNNRPRKSLTRRTPTEVFWSKPNVLRFRLKSVKQRTMTEKIYTENNGEYLKNNPTWHVEDSPWKAKQIIKMLSRNPINPKSIAEVGCGAGEILNQLHLSMPNDVSFTGYDISSDAIKIAKKREKDRLEFKHENFLETNERFDLLLMIDVFEHVDDYLGFLKMCKNKAKYTIFHIPLDISAQAILRNLLISGRKSLGHLHYFMKETAIATLVDSGYDIVDFFYTAGSLDLHKTLKSKIAFLPRILLYKANKDIAAKLLGGFSLLVLTK